MPKTRGPTGTFDPTEYATVAERISLFYQSFPSGRIVTELVRRTESDVVFKAVVFRAVTDAQPASTGWAAEREGDGDINTVACLENTETSAIGRALANLGFTASRQRPSAEEMAKARRAREHRAASAASRGSTRSRDPLQARADLATDVLGLIALAESFGLRSARAERWRAALLDDGSWDARTVMRAERRLRAWLRRRAPGLANAVSPSGA